MKLGMTFGTNSAGVERAIRKTNLTKTKLRSRMLDDTLNAILCINSNKANAASVPVFELSKKL